MHASQELSSWKEIAQFLGVSVRTAQKWEKELGLPVRRIPGSQSVFALADELTRWKLSQDAQPEPTTPAPPHTAPAPTPRPWRLYAAAGGVLVLCLFLFLFLRRPAERLPSAYRLIEQRVVIFDMAGAELWSVSYPAVLNPRLTKVWIGDLDGDQRPEVLIGPNMESVFPDYLSAYSTTGAKLWEFHTTEIVRTAEEAFSADYVVRDFAVLPADPSGKRRVAVANTHRKYFPAQLALLDFTGRPVRQYWHAGHLTRVISFGKTVLAGGVRNATNEATLVQLDPQAMSGASKEPASHQLLNLGTDPALRRIGIPRSCINRSDSAMNVVNEIALSGDRIDMGVLEIFEPREATLQYALSPDFKLIQMTRSTMYESLLAKRFHNLDPACLAQENARPPFIIDYRKNDDTLAPSQ